MPRRFATAGEGSVWSLASVRMEGATLLARGGADGVVRLVDAPGGYTVRSLEPPHQGPVRALLALPDSPDGDVRLASGGVDGIVRLWDLTSNEPPLQRRFLNGEVWALTYLDTPTGIKLVGTGSGGLVQIWDPRRDEAEPAFDGISSAWALSNVPLGERTLLAAGTAEGTIRLWDPVLKTTVRVIDAHASTVWALASIQAGGRTLLASGGADARVFLWDPLTGEQVRRFAGHSSTVRVLGVIQTDRGPRLASGSADSTIKVWNPDATSDEAEYSFDNQGEIWALAQLDIGDQRLLAGGGAAGTVWQYDLKTRQRSRLLGGASNTIWALAAIPDATPAGGVASTALGSGTALGGGTTLASGGVTGTIRLVNLDGGDERDLVGHESTVRALTCVTGTGTGLLASGGADGSVRLWDVIAGRQSKALRQAHVGEVWSLTSFATPQARFVASGGADGQVILWRADGETVDGRVIGDHGGEIYALTNATVDGRVLVICGGPQGRIDVWDTDGNAVNSFGSGGGTIWAFAAYTVPHGARIACALADGSVVLFEPATGRSAGVLAEQGSRVRALQAVRVGGRTLVAGGCHDGVVRLWDVDAMRKVAELPAHTGTVRGLAVAGSGGDVELASAGDDGAVVLHELTGSFERITTTARARPNTQIASDRPSRRDLLDREAIVSGLRDFLTDPNTEPPVVVGVQGPWGEGKSTVLAQLREQLDPGRDADVGGGPQCTHRVVWGAGGPQRKLTPRWALRRLAEYGSAPTRDLVARLEAVPGAASGRITVWFSPWMYNSREELWAGLCQEIIREVTGRLSEADQRRLWFELNLRRSDPVVVRKRVLLAFSPHTPWGVAGAVAALALAGVALMAVGSAVVEDPRWAAAFVGFPALGLLLRALWTAMRGSVNDVLPPGMLTGPTVGGMAQTRASRSSSEAVGDPLHESRAGYLYLLQHDIGQIVGMATTTEPITIFIDDLDRCSSDMINEMIEAVNLFVNNAFGECNFVIALDPVTVAAHIEGANDVVLRRIEADPGTYRPLRDTGWRFMEKIIMLPIRLPRLFDDAVAAYAQDLLVPSDPLPNRVVVEAAPPAERRRARRRQRAAAAANAPVPAPLEPGAVAAGATVKAGRPDQAAVTSTTATTTTATTTTVTSTTVTTAATATVRGRASVPAAGSSGTAQRLVPATRAGTESLPAESQVDEEASVILQVEAIPEVAAALRASILNLPRRSPREIKRFVNLWRFYLNLEQRQDRLVGDIDELTRRAMAVAWLVEVMLRWPKYLDRFAGRRGDNLTLSTLAKAADADEPWAAAAKAALLDPDDLAVAELRNMLLATDEVALTSVARRYL